MSSLSAQHWNGNQACAIDTETTGIEPGYHEVIQVAVLPLDCNFDVRKDVMPFNVLIRPNHPERKERGVPYSKEYWERVMDTGYDPVAAFELFEEWYAQLKLGYKKYGSRQNQIFPIGMNYQFDKYHIQHWMGGPENYNFYIHYHYRDVMLAALTMNDIAAFKAEDITFPKVGLASICSKLGVKNERAHDALSDCKATAECYKRLMSFGGFI